MANKLISQLTAGPILVTDLLEHEPLAGPPSLKGDVTALFSDASSVLAIDRDNRRLVNNIGQVSLDWNITQAFDNLGNLSLDWDPRKLFDSAAGLSTDWQVRQLVDAASVLSVDWNSRTLMNSSGATFLDFSTGTGTFVDPLIIDQTNRFLIDSGAVVSIDWESRQLSDTGGLLTIDFEIRNLVANDGATVVLDYTTQQPSSGAQTADSVYDTVAQTMIQEMYDAMRAYGLLS